MPEVGRVFLYTGAYIQQAPDGRPYVMEIIEDNPADETSLCSFRHGMVHVYSHRDIARMYRDITDDVEGQGG